MNYNEIEIEPIVEEQRERDLVHTEEITEEVESNDIYVGRVFADKRKPMVLIIHTRCQMV